MRVYTVYDSKAEAYLQPFYARTNGEAMRSFTDAANQKDHNFSRFAADFTLFCIGEFDENSGTLHSLKAPESLAKAIDLIRESAQ